VAVGATVAVAVAVAVAVGATVAVGVAVVVGATVAVGVDVAVAVAVGATVAVAVAVAVGVTVAVAVAVGVGDGAESSSKIVTVAAFGLPRVAPQLGFDSATFMVSSDSGVVSPATATENVLSAVSPSVQINVPEAGK
jgi:hypothetical protein